MITRDDIAQAIREYLPGADGKSDSQTIAGEIMPLVRRAQAEVLREAADGARWALGDASSGHTSTYSVRKWLREHADRIEKEGAGA